MNKSIAYLIAKDIKPGMVFMHMYDKRIWFIVSANRLNDRFEFMMMNITRNGELVFEKHITFETSERVFSDSCVKLT